MPAFDLTILILSADAILLGALLIQQHQTNQLIKHMAKTAAELAQDIRDSNAQTRKATDEILARFKKLEDIIAAGGDLTEIEAAVSELKVSTQTLDDIVPDAPPAEPTA